MALGPAAFERGFSEEFSEQPSKEFSEKPSEGSALHQPLGESSSTPPPLVSLVIPAYNEAAILERNLLQLCEHLVRLGAEFTSEIVLVNDGSRDRTGALADAFALDHDSVRVVHHSHNQGLGQALRTGFEAARGRYIVTLDLDLSYAPAHIERLVRHMRRTGAQVVVASPYMPGGRVSSVPRLRLWLSIWANRFLSLAAKRDLSTLTGMVRAYDGAFLRSLHPRANGMDINPELLHKAQLLKASVEEIPAHLHWLSPESAATAGRSVSRAGRPSQHSTPVRSSSMKILRQVWSVLFYGFAFRPVMFFLLPSLLCLSLGGGLLIGSGFLQGIALPSEAFYAGTLGVLAIAIGTQLLTSAALSAQNKFYFEELFHLGTHGSSDPEEESQGGHRNARPDG